MSDKDLSLSNGHGCGQQMVGCSQSTKQRQKQATVWSAGLSGISLCKNKQKSFMILQRDLSTRARSRDPSSSEEQPSKGFWARFVMPACCALLQQLHNPEFPRVARWRDAPNRGCIGSGVHQERAVGGRRRMPVKHTIRFPKTLTSGLAITNTISGED